MNVWYCDKTQTTMESTRLAGEELLRALSHHDWEGIRRVGRSDYIHHAPGVPEAGLDKYIATLQLVVAAVPDMTLEIQQIVATDEYATLRYTVRGTHLHNFHGIPPSGSAIEMPVIGLVRVMDGLLAEGWYVFDSGMLIMQSLQLHRRPASAGGQDQWPAQDAWRTFNRSCHTGRAGRKDPGIRCVARPKSLHAFHRGRCVDGDLSRCVSIGGDDDVPGGLLRSKSHRACGRAVGWTLSGETPEVCVLCSGGHSKGGVAFYIPEHKFLMLADETTAVPISPDTDPRRVVSTAQKALTMLDNGALEWLCAGHFPMVPSKDPNEVGASLQRIFSQSRQFSDMKLTLLNHLLLYNFPSRKEFDGKIRFLPSLPT
jgi:predicted ester cyclase